MKALKVIFFIGLVTFFQCKQAESKPEDVVIEAPDFSSVSQVENGKPVSVMLTSYSTTLLAKGKDRTQLRIAVTDSLGREITSATDSIQLYVTGKGTLKSKDEKDFVYGTDTTGTKFAKAKLKKRHF